ncbi:MAG: hypothetical protein R6X29_04790 [Acidimicrobiia bacterium]|jgi:uncharacterized membrane protein HdeD (DUF308 family)
MEEFATQFADLLERTAGRVRQLTADRAANVIRIASLGLPVLVLGVLAVVFLFMTLHGALSIPLGSAGAFAVMAGLFLVAGAFVWRKRRQAPEETT